MDRPWQGVQALSHLVLETWQIALLNGQGFA